MTNSLLCHKHILITATGLTNPPKTPEVVNDWLLRLVEAVGMKVFIAPQSRRCDEPGNEGVTGIVCIETSHASLHCWDAGPEQPFVQIDLYSCREFDEDAVLDMVDEFGPSFVVSDVIDRSPFAG